MGILLAFAPFIVFALLDRLMGVQVGLTAAALVSVALLARDVFILRRGVKLVDAGTCILFGGIAIYALAFSPQWSIVAVRLYVDAGLLLIVLASLAISRPFTLQYAKETVSPEVWSTPEFFRTNVVISSVWAAAFALMVGADLLMLLVPDVPTRYGVVLTVMALVAAIKFTGWYPTRNAGAL